MERQWIGGGKAVENQWKGGGKAVKSGGKAVEKQGKATERQWKGSGKAVKGLSFTRISSRISRANLVRNRTRFRFVPAAPNRWSTLSALPTGHLFGCAHP